MRAAVRERAGGSASHLGDGAVGGGCAAVGLVIIHGSCVGAASVVGRVQAERLLVGGGTQQAGELQGVPQGNHVAQHPACKKHSHHPCQPVQPTNEYYVCATPEAAFLMEKVGQCSKGETPTS